MSKSIRTFTCALTLALAGLFAQPAAASTPSRAPVMAELGQATAFAAAAALDGKVNINTASAAQLELLPGIGPAIAERIVSYRTKHPFKQLNHIMRVKGVGKKTYAKIKPYLSLEGSTTLSRGS